VTSASPPVPPAGRPAVERWVERHLDGLYAGEAAGSAVFRGGQAAADLALALFDVAGYAARRNEVWPEIRRAASRLSPYIRHGLLPLPRVWAAVQGPDRDVAAFRDELLWQEYARHVYARLGGRTRSGTRYVREASSTEGDAWDSEMACIALGVSELHGDGWVVNQARMWLASHWSIRHGMDWRVGEERFFRHLLDGSRAANRLGWQWTVGTGTGRPYGFSRRQVERRAPGLCPRCRVQASCPIEDPPGGEDALAPIEADPLVGSDPDPDRTAGPRRPERRGTPEMVWITAESLGGDDPALRAHPRLPAVFVFDAPLLRRLGLSGKRLVFLAETLADLAGRRALEVLVGDPVALLRGRAVAATFAPVPGWRSRAAAIEPVEIDPWPWLRRPHGGSVASYSAWRRAADRAP